jgi:hypothetical protein
MDNLYKILDWAGKFESKNEAEEYLSEKGYDVEKEKNDGLNHIKSMLAKAKLNEARSKMEMLNRVKKLMKEKRAEELLASTSFDPTQAYALFSKLEKVSESDALEMLNEKKVLELLEILDKEHE